MTTVRAKRHSQKSANQFVKERGILLPNNQVMLTEPIYVFKKVYVDDKSNYWSSRVGVVANLVIPMGAIVNLAEDYEKKMRANQAYCYSIFNVSGKKEYAEAFSGYDATFKYHSGSKLGLTLEDVKNLVVDQESYIKTTKKAIYSWEKDIVIPDAKRVSDALKKCKVTPKQAFSLEQYTCKSGIHFFIESARAKSYS